MAYLHYLWHTLVNHYTLFAELDMGRIHPLVVTGWVRSLYLINGPNGSVRVQLCGYVWVTLGGTEFTDNSKLCV